MSTTVRRAVAGLTAFLVALLWLPLLANSAAAAEPVVTQDLTVNGCNGVLPTPGSENTTKRLDPTFPSDFNPGGLVGYVIDYPVDPSEFGETFRITDCVFVGGVAVAKYFVDFVPNSESFQLRFSIPIPVGTALGSQFCNYAKTTATPSASQASNRKAGPACFTVGGGLRVEKRSGSVTGPLLSGASFTVVCVPTTTQPPTIITGLSNPSITLANGTVVASGVSVGGTIAIIGPSGTPCTVTETAAPDGYVLDPTPRNLVIPVGDSQTVNVFVNQQLGSLSISKHAVGGAGAFTFTISCNDGNTYPAVTLNVGAGDTVTRLVSDQIPVGTVCTVTEAANPLFSTVRVPANGTVTIDAGGETVAFTNTRRTGDLIVHKVADEDGTFVFDVDCTDNAYDTVVTITTAGGEGAQRVEDIPTTVTCTVTERSNPLFSSFVDPVNGTVVIAVGDNDVWFTNTRLRGDLLVTKAADMDGTFTFDIDCTDNAFDRQNVSITTTNGTGSAEITGIPTGVVCTVTEDANPDWTSTVVPANGTVTIDVGDNAVAFTNLRNRGNLVVTKASDVDGTFTFDIDCTDNAYDANNVTITTVNGTGSLTINGIPTGVVCTVTEDADPRWTHTVVPGNGTVTVAVGANTVAFTNTRVRGDLDITKATNEDGTFVFDVDCTGTEYDVAGLEITTTNGTGSASIDDIPTGVICTVTERANPLFTSTVVPANGTVTIAVGGSAVAFTNVRKTGSLIVTKGIVDESGIAGPHGFTFEVVCGDDDPVVFELGTGEGLGLVNRIDGIPTGTECVVREVQEAGWAVTVTPEDGTVTIGDAPETVAFLNTRLFTDVSLVKSSVPPLGTAVTDGDEITYTLTYANTGNTPAEVAISDEIPDGTTLVAGSAGDAVITGDLLTWTLTIPAGGTGSVSFAVTVNEGLADPFTIRNVALLHEGDEEIPTNEVTHPVAHLQIRKGVDKGEAQYGDELTYTLTIENASAAAVTGIVVTDPLPNGTSFVSASDGGSCDAPCTTVTWPAFDLQPGESAVRTFVVRIDPVVPGPNGEIPGLIVLNAAVAASNEVPDVPSNEVRTIVVEVLGNPPIVNPPAVEPPVLRPPAVEPPPTLPATGMPVPVPHAVALAMALLVGGAGLQFATNWRAFLARPAAR
ncbi:MAG TPA: DUF5979 domain-containing protein [Mycobacteriales bacterium]|nr:DUF5979 domain-containing protein [Mycobacteriales bacterium]